MAVSSVVNIQYMSQWNLNLPIISVKGDKNSGSSLWDIKIDNIITDSTMFVGDTICDSIYDD